jgi:hypothetical protein
MKGAAYIDATLDFLLRTSPRWLALYSDAGAGTELSGDGYARVSLVGVLLAPSGGSITSGVDVTFPEATATWTIGSVAVVDSTGAVVYVEDVSASCAAGQRVRFSAGSITATEA